MATATKAKRIELTEEQRRFLGSQRGGWCSLPKDNYPDYVRQLVHAGYLHYDGLWANAHHWCLTGKARAALKRGRPATTLNGSKQAAGGRSVGRDRRPIQDTDKPSGQLGAFLTAELERLGWSVDEFQKKLAAKKLDKSDDTIRNWLTGSNCPRIPELANIAAALGYEDWLAMLSACRKRLPAIPKKSRK